MPAVTAADGEAPLNEFSTSWRHFPQNSPTSHGAKKTADKAKKTRLPWCISHGNVMPMLDDVIWITTALKCNLVAFIHPAAMAHHLLFKSFHGMLNVSAILVSSCDPILFMIGFSMFFISPTLTTREVLRTTRSASASSSER